MLRTLFCIVCMGAGIALAQVQNYKPVTEDMLTKHGLY